MKKDEHTSHYKTLTHSLGFIKNAQNIASHLLRSAQSEDEAKRVVEALVERGQLRATVDGQGLCRFSELTKTTQDDVNAKLKDCGLLSERMKITQSVMAEEAIREEAENDIVM